jgi:hypothetical protein
MKAFSPDENPPKFGHGVVTIVSLSYDVDDWQVVRVSYTLPEAGVHRAHVTIIK